MAKVNISLPDAMLDEVDSRATRAGLTRSGFIQEAASRYLTSLDESVAKRERTDRIRQALAQMREIAEHLPADTNGTEIIRRFREAPEPWLPGDSDNARDA